MAGCCCLFKTGCAIACIAVGTILLVLGGSLMPIYDAIFVEVLKVEMVIKENSIFFEDIWEQTNTPTYLDYYFLNVTNAEEFLNQSPPGSVKLKVEEIGPYRYREYLSKDRLAYTDDKDLATYRQKTEIYFEEEQSVGSELDQITTINIIAASLLPILEHYNNDTALRPRIVQKVNEILEKNNASLLSTRTVHGLLYGGSPDGAEREIVDFLNSIEPRAEGVLDNFGLFMNSNSSKGWFQYQVYTGVYDINQLAVITKYQGKSKLDYWVEGSHCNDINGTDGQSTPPFMRKEERVYFFVDDVCRSLYGVYEKEVELKGVKGWKVTTPAAIFEAPVRNEDNMCFCHDVSSILCQHDGGISLKTCQHGAPIVISSPHYLFGDGFYLNMVEGLTPPDPELHEAALVYEPNTGIAIKADKRLQINILLEPNSVLSLYKPITDDLLVPIVWVNENGELTKDDANLLTSLLYDIEAAMEIVQIIILVVGGLLFISAVYYLTCRRKSNNSEKDISITSGRRNGSYSSCSSLDEKSKKSSVVSKTKV